MGVLLDCKRSLTFEMFTNAPQRAPQSNDDSSKTATICFGVFVGLQRLARNIENNSSLHLTVIIMQVEKSTGWSVLSNLFFLFSPIWPLFTAYIYFHVLALRGDLSSMSNTFAVGIFVSAHSTIHKVDTWWCFVVVLGPWTLTLDVHLYLNFSALQ